MTKGEATASDLWVVQQFLKDNGIDSVPKKDSLLDRLDYIHLRFTKQDDGDAAGYLPN